MFIIDFDGTLYSTHLLVKEILRVFEAHGVLSEDALSSMKTAIVMGDNLHYDYTYERQLTALAAARYSIDEATVLAELLAITEQNDFTDSGAIAFLEALQSYGKRMVLLTAGNENFQLMKLNSTKMATYFDEVVVVPGDKQEYVAAKCKAGEQVVFVNDKVPENEAVKKHCPEVVVITRRNPHKLVGNGGGAIELPTFDSLEEIASYVSTII